MTQQIHSGRNTHRNLPSQSGKYRKSFHSIGIRFAAFSDMARHPSELSIILLFTIAFSSGACKTLGQVAGGVGRVTAVAAKTLAPAMKVAAKVAVPVAKATARVAQVGAKVARHAAPVARDLGKIAGHVSMEAVKTGVMVGEVIAVDAPYYDSGAYSFDVDPLYWEGEPVALPPSPEPEPIAPTPPSFFDLVNLYQEGLQSCLGNPKSWASVFFFVELDGSVSTSEIVDGSLSSSARLCILHKTQLFRFPPDASTHGLIIRVVTMAGAPR